ncbi:hypothetical protein CPC16_002516, partial [Podila verticillata]
MLALALSVFLASLDQLIVSTSIPAITREFHALGDISWLGTAYMMTTTASQPLYGKFSDIFGRKSTMLFANVIFMVGSVISGWSTSMTMLIIGRGVSGIGAGGLMAMVFIIISDMLDMRERGKYVGFIGAMFSVSSVIGPLLGGAFTDHATWRWSFWINLPISAISTIFVAIYLNLPTPKGSLSDKIKRIDFLGTLVLLAAVVLVLLPLSWGGTKYAWDSGIIIGLLCAAVVSVVLFILVEWRVAREPIVPIHLFKIRNLWATYGSLFFGGMAFFGIFFYLPVYFQVVKGESATVGGLETIPFVFGILFTSVSSGLWTMKKGTFAFFPALGFSILAVGSGLGILFVQDTKRVVTIFVLLVCGLGMGFTLQASTLAVQVAVKPKYMATVTATVQFVRSLGQVFGIAIVGSIFNNKLAEKLKAQFPNDPNILYVAQDYAKIADYDAEGRYWIYECFIGSIHYVFYCAVAVVGLALISSLFIQHKELKTNANQSAAGDKANSAKPSMPAMEMTVLRSVEKEIAKEAKKEQMDKAAAASAASTLEENSADSMEFVKSLESIEKEIEKVKKDNEKITGSNQYGSTQDRRRVTDQPPAKNGPHYNESPEMRASLFSLLTYTWMDPLFKIGYKRQLQEEDLWDMAPEWTAGTVGPELTACWNNEKARAAAKNQQPSLIRAMTWFLLPYYWVGIIYIFLSDNVMRIIPFTVKWIIEFLRATQDTTSPPPPLWHGYALAAGLFVLSMAIPVMNALWVSYFVRAAMLLRTALTDLIFKKATVMSSKARLGYPDSKVFNLMSMDAPRIETTLEGLQFLWIIPFGTLVTVAMLWYLMGPSSLLGTVVLMVSNPTQAWALAKLQTIRERASKLTDNRIFAMTEILQAIKVIKFYAWEK